MSAQRYPLAWPTGWKRTPYASRRRAKFQSTRTMNYPTGGTYRQNRPLELSDALGRVSDEMRRLGVRSGDWLISSNLKIRLDGMPYAEQRSPDDVGVALYFRLKGADRVLACDRWTRIADNLAAVAAHIEALRATDRYGVASLEQAFAGYQALPAKGGTWRSSLGFGPDDVVTREAVEMAFRSRARTAHPDVGGSHDEMASLTEARRLALEELRA